MSLVVLRSWSDGQPPKVKAIAPPDSDEKDQIIIPDHHGRFVTEETRKKEIVPNPEKSQRLPKLIGPGSSSVVSSNRSYSSSPSPTPPISNNILTATTHHFSGAEKTPAGLMHKLDGLTTNSTGHTNLSRCSSVQSGGTESPPPSSPICGSRYRSLGPELSATIPRRQIIRNSWIRESSEDSDSGSGFQFQPLTKKEMSKSTPSLLNFNDDSLLHFQRRSGTNATATPSTTSHNFDTKNAGSGSTSPPTTTTNIFNLRFNKKQPQHQYQRPVSYIDLRSFASLQESPLPASVVEVIKKRPSLESIEFKPQAPPPKPARVTFDLERLKTITSSSTTTSTKKKLYKVTDRSVSADNFNKLINERPGTGTPTPPPEPKPRINSLPTSIPVPPKFSTVKEFQLTPAKPTNSKLNIEQPETQRSPSPFEVHKVIHHLISKASKDEENELTSPKVVEPESDKNVDSSADEIMSGSILKTFHTFNHGPRQQQQVPTSRQAQFKHHHQLISSFQAPTTTTPTAISSSGVNSYGTNHKNGTAWVQVPVQCVNPHVFLPPPYNNNCNSNGSSAPTPSSNIIDNAIFPTNLRRDEKSIRKNFCDELLNDVVLEVPVQITNNKNIPPSGQKHQNYNHHSHNHDGIIIFDEEEEDELVSSDIEGDETESTGGVSERENSFEYMSVFHNVNVKVGSINDLNKDSTTSSTTAPKEREVNKIIGLDLGSMFSHHVVLNTSDNKVHFGETIRSLVTSDGLKLGPEALSHSLSSKSRLIYYWRARQQMSYQYDLCDEEDLNCSLETLLRYYNELILASPSSPHRNSVQWNLSIHSGMSKKLVREAAYNSGLIKSTEELRLINESTAAAVTAYKFLEKNTKKWGKTFLSVNIGSTFIHTSGYEVTKSKLYVIERSDSQVYESPESNFIELFSRLFTKEFLLKYESCFGPSWIEILVRFDEMKRLYFTHQSDCYLYLPISFYTEFYRCTGIQVYECIEDNPEEGITWDSNGALKFNKDLLEEWTEPAINFIKTKLKIKSYDSIVLSGGGATDFIAKELGRLLPFVHVFLVDEAEFAVSKGLVKIESSNITFKSPFSIGVGVMTPFDETMHPKEKCVTRQGKNWCSDVWDSLIRKGEYLTLGQVVLKRSYVGAQPGQSVLVLPIFKSEVEDPKLVTSASVEKCCELRFEIDSEKSWREVQLVIKCYESELSITATGKEGEVNHVSIDL